MTTRILYVQYTNPGGYPPLEHSSRILAEMGWQVLFLGTEGLKVNALRFPSHDRIAVRLMPFCPAGWRQKLHYLRFTLWVVTWALRYRPSWIYASDLLVCPVGLLLSYLPGVKVLYHEHDSPTPTATSAFSRLYLWARRRLAQRARLNVLPNEQRAAHFSHEIETSRPVLCVWNCPRLEEVASCGRNGHAGDDLVLAYQGSIVPSRLPTSVLAALAMLPERVQLHVVGYETIGHEGYVQALREMACRLGISGRVKFIDAMPRSKMMQQCQRYSVGLSLMQKRSADVNMQYMVGASNKPFDYMACGLALLVSDLPEWCALYVEPGYGLACDPDDPQSIAAAVGWFLEHPDEMQKMGERGLQRIRTEWNYEAQFAPVLEQMSERR